MLPMKTEQIIYRSDIAKTNSITQTAQRFFISQQALSTTIKKLEEEFNATFLKRTNKGVVLTEAGEYFLERSKGILDTYFQMKDDLLFAGLTPPPDLSTGEIHIFCHARILAILLIDILEQFTKRYPFIKIVLNEKENIDIIEGVRRRECDLGLIFAPDFLLYQMEEQRESVTYVVPKQIKMEILFSDKFIVCCSKQSPLADMEYVATEDLDNVPMVLFDSNPAILNQDLDKADYEGTRYYSGNAQFHREMLLKNLAASCITSFEFRKLYLKDKNLTAVKMQNSMTSNITLVTDTERKAAPQTELFIEMLKNYDFYRV